MPRHRNVTICLINGQIRSPSCPCSHCTLAVCDICGAYEGSLTTDCPGKKVTFEKQQEVYQTPLDYTDSRGWHQGDPASRGAPRFTHEPPEQPDPTDQHDPTSARSMSAPLQHDLTRKAVAWARADRLADDHAATLTRLETEGAQQTATGRAQLERVKSIFRIASQRAERCDEELHQVSRKIAEDEDI